MLSLQTSTINFEILDINNLKNIVFLDLSSYFEQPENPILEIILPGSNRYLTAPIQAGKINVLDSGTIGLTNVLGGDYSTDFSDGVYRFTYKICPYDYYCISKYSLRTTCLDRSIQNIYNTVDVTQCSKDEITLIKKELLDIYIFLESGKANAIQGNADKASKDYNLALKKVNKITDKLNI